MQNSFADLMDAPVTIHKDFPLKEFNTFGLQSTAEYFIKIDSETQLEEFFTWKKIHLPEKPSLILGGGSNVVLGDFIPGFVVKLSVKGKKTERLKDHTLFSLATSEIWHEAVLYSLEMGLQGLENLALIPGDCGTSPVQNIGAYGVEICDIFHSCRAYNIASGEWKSFFLEDCDFEYRNSFFKQNKDWVITEVTFQLQHIEENFALKIQYGTIQEELEKLNISKPSPNDIANAVIKIRSEKLPNPNIVGNAGSFFKNPVVHHQVAEEIKLEYPDLPTYPTSSNNSVKIPAAFLIEKSGWKGKVLGNVGMDSRQALVLINVTGKATGKEIYQFSGEIIEAIFQHFGILLEREVNCLYCV